MESNKIVVEFAIVGNVVIGKLDEFPKELRGKGVVVENEFYSIRSVEHSEMTPTALYLSGRSKVGEILFSYTFPNVDEAKEAVKNWKQLIRKYNSRFKTDERSEDSIIEWERVE